MSLMPAANMQPHSGPQMYEKAIESAQAATGSALTATEDELSQRRTLGRELREARTGAGLSQEQLARQMPDRRGRTGVARSWIGLMERQPTPAASRMAELQLPTRSQLLAWARACGLAPDSLLDRAKELLPRIYPELFMFAPKSPPVSSEQSFEDPKWHTAGPAGPESVVERVRSLLEQAVGHDSVVTMTFMGPLRLALLSLSSAASSGSLLEPVYASLARNLQSGGTVRHLWSVGERDGREVDWVYTLPNLLTLAGSTGSARAYECRRVSQHREYQMDLAVVVGRGGLVILRQEQGFVTIPVPDTGATLALMAHFDYLARDSHPDELFRVFSWGKSPEKLIKWEEAMADADESPGWRMLIQPGLGTVTMPESVQDRVLGRWRQSCNDARRVEQSYQLDKVRNRKRNGFRRSLERYPCYDIVAGPAFQDFVDKGTLQEDWIWETRHERLDHLVHILELLGHSNYHLAIVDRSDDMYRQIFGFDPGPSGNREFYWLLKRRIGDNPSIFTSTYWLSAKSCSFEVRSPAIFDAYYRQAEAIRENLAPAMEDKAAVISRIQDAIEDIHSYQRRAGRDVPGQA